MLLQIFIYNILLPAVLAGSGVLFFRGIEEYGNKRIPCIITFSLLAGYTAGYYGIAGSISLFPQDASTGWFIHIGIAVFLLSFAELYWKENKTLLWIGRALFTALTCRILLSPLIEYTWSIQNALIMGAASIAIIVIMWCIFSDIKNYAHPPLFPLYLTIFATFESILILLSSSIFLAQLQGVTAAALGALTVLMWLFPQVSINEASINVIYILFAAHALNAFFYADLSLFSVILLCASLLSSLLIWRKGTGKKENITVFLTSIVLLGLAIFLTII